ncbi:YciI family protein [Rhizobium leguminosarum]|uniref:YciI family protein n=1 Tax=Rhizobium leguminosarum TaxID=384 RepID=UPI003ECF835E
MNMHIIKAIRAGSLTGRRAILTLAIAAIAAFGAAATFAPVAVAQDAAAAKAGVFAVIYERGSAYEDNKNITEQANIKDHVAYGQTLGGKFLAGGLLGSLTDDKVLGMVVFEAENIEAAKQWVSQDPGIQNNVLSATVRHWQVTNIKAFQGK